MRNFLLISSGIDVLPLKMALQVQPELWNSHIERRSFKDSSHKDTSDLWIRYNDIENLKDDYDKFTDEHDSVWYPAYFKLPLRNIVFGLMARCSAVRLGGVLITKIPAKGKVQPHIDKGWHPEYYNMKVYIPIQTNPYVVNYVEDESVVMNEGEAWYFNNTKIHAVENNGNDDRITLIVCMKVDG